LKASTSVILLISTVEETSILFSTSLIIPFAVSCYIIPTSCSLSKTNLTLSIPSVKVALSSAVCHYLANMTKSLSIFIAFATISSK